MKIIDEKLVASFRCMSCEHCRQVTPSVGHHIFGKGHGGGLRLDIKENLISLCVICHRMVHDGNLPRDTMLEIVALRMKKTAEKIREKIWKLQRKRRDEPDAS